MKPADLVEVAKHLDPDKEILCQVVATDGQAWMMHYNFNAGSDFKSSFNLLTVYHPDLKQLPPIQDPNIVGVVETCDHGHKFRKLPDHPTKDGKARCPYCMAIGIDQFMKG